MKIYPLVKESFAFSKTFNLNYPEKYSIVPKCNFKNEDIFGWYNDKEELLMVLAYINKGFHIIENKILKGTIPEGTIMLKLKISEQD